MLRNNIGTNPLMTSDQVGFIGCVSSRDDFGNEGLTQIDREEKVQELCSYLNCEKAFCKVS